MLKRFPSYGRPPADTPAFPDTLRYMIVGRIHAGLLEPGVRLPSIRDLAARSGVDHRVAARAYRDLEIEGLVEVRRKSGVFVASPLATPAPCPAAGSVAAEALYQGWESGVSRSALCGLFGGNLSSPLRCGCIESNEDHMVALTGELEDALSLETVPMFVEGSSSGVATAAEDLDEVDFLVTTVFHARHARALADAAGKPLAILTLRRDFSDEIAKRLAAGLTTVVAADPRYGEVAREFFEALGYAVPIRFLSVDEALREGVDPADGSLLITRAARRRMGLEEYHLIRSRLISAESARALCQAVASAAPRRRPRLRLAGPSEAAWPSRLAATPPESGAPSIVTDTASVCAEVERALCDGDLFEALRTLNRSTPHRFTGVYRFEPGWVRSYALYDRENPHLRVGADVPMKESYCVLAADAGETFRIENAATDPRLAGHKATGAVLCYCAVHLSDARGRSWGTLCHYDFRPSPVEPGTTAVLEAVRPIIERVLPPAAAHERLLPECAVGHRPLREALS